MAIIPETFHYKDGVLTKQDYYTTPHQIPNVTKIIDGTPYLPLKYFAEFEGKAVVRKDNIYVIDYIANVNDILDSETYPELKATFDSLSIQPKNGKTYYVSQEAGASDSNPGTAEKPFNTIKKAADIAKAGDTVIIKGGVYHEMLAPKNNGTASNPITFKAAEGETVQLSNLKELGAPVGTQGDMLIYEALTDLGYGKNQLFYSESNKHLVAGRHPNEHTNPNKASTLEGLDPVWPIHGNMTQRQSDGKYVESPTDLDQPKDHWVGGTVVAMEGYGWTMGTAVIDESGPGWVHVNKYGRWWYDPELLSTDYGYITNHINTVDLPGEWAFDNGKFYIIPPEGETAETLKLSQKMSHVSFDLKDSKFIVIDGIDSIGGGAMMNNSEMCVLMNGKYEYISHYTYSHDQRDGYIDDKNKYNQDGPPERGEQGFYVGGTDNAFVNNEFLFSAAAALFITGTYTYIENNHVADTGYGGSYVGGIYTTSRAWEPKDTPRGGSSIFNNTIARTGRHGLGISTNEDYYAGTTPDNGVAALIPEVCAYNNVHDGSITARDTAPWYQYGVAAGTERVKSRHYNNFIWNSWAQEGSLNSLGYYDGMTSMFQNYGNLYFWTNNEVPYGTNLYKQKLSTAVGIVDDWNNSFLQYVPGGDKALTKDMYPGGKMFLAGASFLAEDTTPMLNNMDVDVKAYPVDKGRASQGSKIEGGLFVPQETESYLTYSGIDFGTGVSKANAIRLFFTGDPCNTGDKVKVIIGSDIKNPVFEKEVEIAAEAPSTVVIDDLQVNISGVEGTQNVYLMFTDIKSAKLAQIKIEKSTKIDDRVITGVWADTGTKVSGNATLSPTAPEAVDGHKYYLNMSGNSTFLYENVEIKEAANEFMMAFGSYGNLQGQGIKVYLDGPDGELICDTYGKGNAAMRWDYYPDPLLRVLEPGKYNICIVFADEDTADGMTKKTGNFMRFALGFNSEYDVPSATPEVSEEATEEVVEGEAVTEETAEEKTEEQAN